MESNTLPGHFTFQMLQRLLLQYRLLHKITGIIPSIIGTTHNPSRYEEIQRVDHAVIKIRMICILNEDSPSINTRGDPLKRGQKKRQKRVKKGF